MGGVGHHRFTTLGVPQADVHVARRTDVIHGPLGHERGGAALLRCDLLDAVLEHEVPVRGHEGFVVGDVDLVLSTSCLALRELHRDLGVAHLVADTSQHVLLTGGLEQLVVLNGRGVGSQILPTFGGRLLIGVVEEEELELGGAAHAQTALGGPLELASQDLPGRHLDRRALLVGQVAHHHGSASEPRDAPSRRVVGPADKISVAGVPVREAVTRERGHVDVDGEQVVARLDPVLGDMGSEEVRGHPFAHRASVHIRESHHDGVDGPVGYPCVDQLAPWHAPC